MGMMKVIEVAEVVVMVRISGDGSCRAYNCGGVHGSGEGDRSDGAGGGGSGDGENEQRLQW